MNIRYTLSMVLAALLCIFLFGCGDSSDHLSATDKVNYVPNINGSYWVYQVQPQSGPTFTATDTIRGTRTIDGQVCQVMEHVNSTDPAYIRRTFFTDDDSHVLNIWGHEQEHNGQTFGYHEFEGGFTVFTYPIEAGAQAFSVGRTGVNITDIQYIGLSFPDNDLDNDGIDDTVDYTLNQDIPSQEDIVVPAGTFPNCFFIRQTIHLDLHLSSWGEYSTDGTRYMWFEPDTGFVKRSVVLSMPETIPDLDFTEQLQSYDTL